MKALCPTRHGRTTGLNFQILDLETFPGTHLDQLARRRVAFDPHFAGIVSQPLAGTDHQRAESNHFGQLPGIVEVGTGLRPLAFASAQPFGNVAALDARINLCRTQFGLGLELLPKQMLKFGYQKPQLRVTKVPNKKDSSKQKPHKIHSRELIIDDPAG
ncbi:hypothetical protein [Pontiella sulfatireligans]|uniref:hypothetical protein n=1 Tax=Pontiella sulfatireligans TaxID=2750658 RepID=UPI00109C4139|nr:hypothetical protein [Pontiella sulfatireligans]